MWWDDLFQVTGMGEWLSWHKSQSSLETESVDYRKPHAGLCFKAVCFPQFSEGFGLGVLEETPLERAGGEWDATRYSGQRCALQASASCCSSLSGSWRPCRSVPSGPNLEKIGHVFSPLPSALLWSQLQH